MKVICEKRNATAYITLNRPECLNALDTDTHRQLSSIFDDIESDESIRLAVVTGSGETSFCSGQDLKELAQSEAQAQPKSFGSKGLAGWPRFTERFNFSKPVIARVNGCAIGGGFELALACDIIIAVDTAYFSLPEAQLGLIPGAGGVFRLMRQIPHKIAMEYLLTGKCMDAQRAYQLGLVNAVVGAHQLDGCVTTYVNAILQCAPISTYAIKESAYRSIDLSLEDAFEAEYKWETERLNKQDCFEGAKTFLAQRN